MLRHFSSGIEKGKPQTFLQYPARQYDCHETRRDQTKHSTRRAVDSRVPSLLLILLRWTGNKETSLELSDGEAGNWRPIAEWETQPAAATTAPPKVTHISALDLGSGAALIQGNTNVTPGPPRQQYQHKILALSIWPRQSPTPTSQLHFSLCHSLKLTDFSPSSSPIKKKNKSATTAGRADMEDNMAITIKRSEDILKTELAAMCSEFSSHMTTVQNMCSKVDFLIGEQREQKKVINEHTGRLDALEQQVIDLQDLSRRSNLRLLGLPEGAEKDDPIGFLKPSLPRWLPSLSGKDIEIKRALRVYSSIDHFKPRMFLFKLLRYNDRSLILNEARRHSPVKANDGAMLNFFSDFSPATVKKWSSFSIIRKELKEAGLQTFLQYPATLKIVMKRDQTNALTGRSASIPEFHTCCSFS
ncbi:hypothetical protein QQF64_014320 [Cirrhinus molitorella]|uniref:Uncharacterized protein n=1 Tax=Cirrhinus molitorella TaxID=172907 RepID=A0ABR3NRR0_9TELE